MQRANARERNLALYEAITKLESVDQCIQFFDDLCAITELKALEQRYEVATMLCKRMVYSDIIEQTKASSATISRVNRIVNYGTGVLVDSITEQLESSGETPET